MNIPYITSRGNGYPDEVETRVTHFYYVIRDYSGASFHFLTLLGTDTYPIKSHLFEFNDFSELPKFGGICDVSVPWRGTRHGDSALLIPQKTSCLRHPQCYPINHGAGFPEATPLKSAK